MAADYTPQAGCCQNAMLSKTNIGDMAKPHKKLILASTSAYRAQLLDRLLVSYQQVSPHVDEKRILNERYADLAARLSEEKASGVTESHCLVIGSDQVAVLDNEQLHKPGSVAKAKAQLAKASEKTIHFYTGVSLRDTDSGRCQTQVVEYRATLRKLSSEDISRYVLQDQPLDCAGAFRWESLGIALMAKLEGNDPTALQGLPLIALSNMLRAEGYLLP